MEENSTMEQGEFSREGMPEAQGDRMQQPEQNQNQTQEYRQVKKLLSTLGFRYLAGSILIFAVQNGAVLLINYLKPEWISSTTGQLIVSMLPMYLIGIPLLYLMIKGLPATEPSRHKMGGWKIVLAGIICYALMYCGNIVGMIMTAIIGILKGGTVQNTLTDVVMNTNLMVTFLIMVICAPIIEELVFRKLIIDRTLRYGQGVAILVSGLMFGLFHGNLNQFIYAFLLGICFAFLYVKTGNIKISIGLHMFINFMGSILGMWILKLIDIDAIMELNQLMTAGAGEEELISAVMSILPNLVIYLGYLGLLFAIVIAGVILLIVAICKKKITLEPGEISIPKGKRFSTVICNPGMFAYCALWTGIIVWQLFM